MMMIMVMMMMMVTIVMWRMGRLEMMCGSCLRQCALAEKASTVWELWLLSLYDKDDTRGFLRQFIHIITAGGRRPGALLREPREHATEKSCRLGLWSHPGTKVELPQRRHLWQHLGVRDLDGALKSSNYCASTLQPRGTFPVWGALW